VNSCPDTNLRLAATSAWSFPTHSQKETVWMEHPRVIETPAADQG
jgi:hypothetical protein